RRELARSSDHRSSSSSLSSDSSSVHSSGFVAPDQAYSGPSTRVASPRLVYPPVRAPRHNSPDEMASPEHISLLPATSPFLCTNSFESSDGPSSQDPYVAVVARWRSKADSKSEPAEQRPDKHESLASSSEFLVAPVVAPPRIRQWPVILV
nr:hypothetical protein [Tanacetum cinerariifolium]